MQLKSNGGERGNSSFVSIIIPCRNEEKLIGQCLDSIVRQDYPKDKMEVLVVDGNSEDKTKIVIGKYVQNYFFIRILENPKKIIPSALNIGIKNAKGSFIMKIDAHTVYPIDYVSKCLKYLKEYKADNVGGVIKTVPREKTFFGKTAALILTSPFGAGNAHFRIGVVKPKWVDTAPFGCYPREVFQKVGLYDENIARSEDMDLNIKLRKIGGKILLVPDIVTYYYVRSGFGDFIKHTFDNGFWITYPLKFKKLLFSWRHLAPLALFFGLSVFAFMSFFSPVFRGLFFLLVASYLLMTLFFSLKIVLQEKDFRYLFLIPIVFVLFHLTYGLGSLWGLIKIIIH